MDEDVILGCMLDDAFLKRFSKLLVLWSFRNGPLENIHAGTFPNSKTGDYSDVKVVSPYGEIPWNDLSRISQTEMKSLMIRAVNIVFTMLRELTGPNGDGFLDALFLIDPAHGWNEPKPFSDTQKAIREYLKRGMVYQQIMFNGIQKGLSEEKKPTKKTVKKRKTKPRR